VLNRERLRQSRGLGAYIYTLLDQGRNGRGYMVSSVISVNGVNQVQRDALVQIDFINEFLFDSRMCGFKRRIS
jgi:hypothetical protein